MNLKNQIITWSQIIACCKRILSGFDSVENRSDACYLLGQIAGAPRAEGQSLAVTLFQLLREGEESHHELETLLPQAESHLATLKA